jgi:hypothetical protein
MAKQAVNIGAAANDGSGTPARSAFDFINQNFDEIYSALGGGSALNAKWAELRALSSGIVAAANANSLVGRELTGTVDEIEIANANGVAGDPVLSLAPGTHFDNGLWIGGPIASHLEATGLHIDFSTPNARYGHAGTGAVQHQFYAGDGANPFARAIGAFGHTSASLTTPVSALITPEETFVSFQTAGSDANRSIRLIAAGTGQIEMLDSGGARSIATLRNGAVGVSSLVDAHLSRLYPLDFGFYPQEITHASSGSVAIDLTVGGNHVHIDVQAAITGFTFAGLNDMAAGSSPKPYYKITIEIEDDGGGHAVTWPGSVNWGDAGAPTPQSGKTMVVVLYTRDNGTSFRAFLAGEGF